MGDEHGTKGVENEVSSDGCYNIGKMVAGEWVILVGWSESDLIRLGRQTNILRVKRET